jgi:hypothetical protein
MLAVRLFGRIPIASNTIKRTSCLRLLAGITSGASALTVTWKYYRVHASSHPHPHPKFDPNKIQSIIREAEGKKVSSPAEKFSWELFWYYLRPQIWIIACATAVRLFIFSLINKIKFYFRQLSLLLI